MNIHNHSTVSVNLDSYPRYLFVHTPNLPYSTVSLWLRAGSRFDPQGKEGLAHFTEHLLMKRTKKFPEVVKRLEHMEEKGIRYGALTTKDPAYYVCIQGPGETLEAFKFLLDGFLNSLVDERSVGTEKKVVIDELKRRKGGSSSAIWKLANKGIWRGTRFEHEILGNQDSIKKITINDINEFWKRYYTLGNLTVLVLSPRKNHCEKIERELSGLKKERKLVLPKEKFIKPKKYIISKREGDFVRLAATFLTKKRKTDEEIVSLGFIRNYLAGGWISKLVQRLRIEESLTYWVNGYTKNYPDAGFIRFVFSTQKATLKRTLAIFVEEVDKLKTVEISKEELRKYIKNVKLRTLLDTQNSTGLLWHYGWNTFIYGRKPQSLQAKIKSIENLSPERVINTASEQFRNLSLAAIGPVTEKGLQSII